MTAQADLSSRYGKRTPARPPAAPGERGRRPLKRSAAFAVVAALLVACGVTAWFAFAPTGTPQGTKNISYDVVDSTLTLATVSVVPDEERDIVCGVQAVSERDAVVGYVEMEVPADPQADTTRPVTLHAEIATTQLASSGHLDTCWYADDPPQ
ncbi:MULTISPECIES: DUF4307 domain-containing protein [Brevibacterium]|uniref:DUF4307 domain-containing protein n=1 Tax=Brevibacterium salitolerans TaxID=1403566 RepID=A0ABN2W9I6_9MICO|nr:DUF4307 domain-containing protein [Brevibacterium sp.]